MIRQPYKRKCKHCKAFFDPGPRNTWRQRYCSKPPCRKASKAASQRRWLAKPQNRDDFRGPPHVERVRQWRQAHPGYWRRQASSAQEALQEPLTPHGVEKQYVEKGFGGPALQDSLFTQPAVLVGLIAHLRDST